MIGNIIFLIGGKDLLTLQILPFYLIEKIGVAAVFDIIQDRLRRCSFLRNFASDVAEKVLPTLAIT